MKKKYDYFIYYFPLFAFLFIGMGSILLSVSLSSCSSSVKNPLLLCADSLMEVSPDSALSILESISSPQKLSRADRALYALLLTQARHKNYVPLDDDSLIKAAVDYYGDRDKSLRAAQAHYYWGATYRDMGRTSFAVEEYLKAIRLMPEQNEFLAMIYDNLAECYEEEDLDDVAMEAYRKAYQILKGGVEQIYPLRGMARVFLLQNEKDSALYYYQQALDCAVAVQDSALMEVLYYDLATIYNEEKNYIQANKYVSKAIETMGQNKSIAYLLKAKIMLNMNNLDSTNYFFSKDIDRLDIYGKAICYNGMYQVAKRKGEWKAAVDNLDTYVMLYDSIQGISDNEELVRLMDNYQLEEYKRKLSEHTRTLIMSLVVVFISLMIICLFLFLWNDRKRKKYYIALQHELNQKRIDTMLLKEETFSGSNQEDINKKLSELREEQLQLCISVFQTTDCYRKLEALENATPKQLLLMHNLRTEINATICKTFVDVMANLKECCPTLTNDDLFYCILSLLHCSKVVIMELMNATSDALKTRKNRIKNKMDQQLFESVFTVDNQ